MNVDECDSVIAALCTTIAVAVRRKKKKRRKRLVWVKPWIAKREQDGAFHKLLKDLADDPLHYKNFLRMDLPTFESLLSEIEAVIKKKDTTMRNAIPPAEQLAVTLRYLATGESYTSLQYQFRIGKGTLSSIIPKVCSAINSSLGPKYITCPNTVSQWEEVAEHFYSRWQLPNCLGAIDGKHVKIQHPPGSGSDYYNYKSFFSIVLMAVVGPNLEFLFADVGCQGRISDGGVLKNSVFYEALENKLLNLPQPKALPIEDYFEESSPVVPYYFVGDDAFALSENLMKPYPNRGLTEEERIFNYRLSRARRVSENAFGILSARFRVYHTSICLRPESATSVVHASLVLHNYLMRQCVAYTRLNENDSVKEHNVTNGSTMENFVLRGGNHKRKATSIRDTLCSYVKSSGQVSWQWKILLP